MKANLIKSLSYGFFLMLFIVPNASFAQLKLENKFFGPDPSTLSNDFLHLEFIPHINGAHTIKWWHKEVSQVENFTILVSENNINFTEYKVVTIPEPKPANMRILSVYMDEFIGKSRFVKIRANLMMGDVDNSPSKELLFYATKKTQINTWPNPVLEEVQIADINTDVTDLVIYDQHGSIKHMERINSNDSNKTLNIGDYKTGFYHLVLLDNNGRPIQSKRLFKQ